MSRNYLDILQITDIHFREKVNGTIYGVETQILFEKTFAQLKQELKQTGRAIDLLLATGDISQDGSPESYQRFHQFLEDLEVPCYYLQGNHDYAQPMIDQFGSDRVAPCVVSEQGLGSPWNIILLNSSVEDQVGGHYSAEQLAYLEKTLSEDKESPTMLCFHHHAMPINCEWLDKQVIDNADEFFRIVDQFNNIKLCIYGHVHQDRRDERKGVPYYASPSTCAQFKPEVKDFALDEAAPAYRWIRCFDDGSFETEVRRLKDFSASS